MGGGRLITLERDSDQVTAQAERVHDLGRRRQQGHQTHRARIDADPVVLILPPATSRQCLHTADSGRLRR